MKNTKQKLLILDIINNNRCHNTAESVYDIARTTIPNISLGTVYRNLNNLVNENKVTRIKMKDGIDRYDHKLYLHDHFICTNCNNIIDIDRKDSMDVQNLNHNRVMSYEVYYRGICKECLEKER